MTNFAKLPVDMTRLIFDHLLNSEPLLIFKHSEYIFHFGEYNEEEQIRLIINSLKKSFKLTNTPLFSLFSVNELCKEKNFLIILNYVKSQIVDFSFIYDENSFHRTCSISENLKLVKWLHSVGCPWNNRATKTAVENRNIETLEWLCSQNPPCPINVASCYVSAGINIDFTALIWLNKNYPQIKIPDICSYYSVRASNYKITKWLLKNGCEWNDYCIEAAAMNGNLEMIEWLINKDCPLLNHMEISMAINNNDKECVELLYKLGCDLKEFHLFEAIKQGNFELFSFIRKNIKANF